MFLSPGEAMTDEHHLLKDVRSAKCGDVLRLKVGGNMRDRLCVGLCGIQLPAVHGHAQNPASSTRLQHFFVLGNPSLFAELAMLSAQAIKPEEPVMLSSELQDVSCVIYALQNAPPFVLEALLGNQLGDAFAVKCLKRDVQTHFFIWR